jgi:osmotically-inducible protein OsmY
MLLAAPSIEIMAVKHERGWTNDAMQVAAVCVVSLTFALLACRTSDEENAMAQAKKPIGAGDAGKANAKLEAAVRAKLDGDAQLEAAQLAVSADVTRNAVTLTGSVSSEELRRRAVELARETQAGVLVNDRIVVKPRASSSGPARAKKFYA